MEKQYEQALEECAKEKRIMRDALVMQNRFWGGGVVEIKGIPNKQKPVIKETGK